MARTTHEPKIMTGKHGGEWEISEIGMAAALDEIDRLRAMLRSGMCMMHGLACPGCGQGREMAAKCCRDADCDAGFYGIGCDEVKDWLEAADAIMPGTLAEIENPPEPINLVAPAQGK